MIPLFLFPLINVLGAETSNSTTNSTTEENIESFTEGLETALGLVAWVYIGIPTICICTIIYFCCCYSGTGTQKSGSKFVNKTKYHRTRVKDIRSGPGEDV